MMSAPVRRSSFIVQRSDIAYDTRINRRFASEAGQLKLPKSCARVSPYSTAEGQPLVSAVKKEVIHADVHQSHHLDRTGNPERERLAEAARCGQETAQGARG